MRDLFKCCNQSSAENTLILDRDRGRQSKGCRRAPYSRPCRESQTPLGTAKSPFPVTAAPQDPGCARRTPRSSPGTFRTPVCLDLARAASAVTFLGPGCHTSLPRAAVLLTCGPGGLSPPPNCHTTTSAAPCHQGMGKPTQPSAPPHHSSRVLCPAPAWQAVEPPAPYSRGNWSLSMPLPAQRGVVHTELQPGLKAAQAPEWPVTSPAGNSGPCTVLPVSDSLLPLVLQ